MADLPHGTITLLFTDIEGSTRLWEHQPQAMQMALTRHDAILRHTIVHHGGTIFKTVGDAFCAAFTAAPDAIAAAVAAQRALQREPWGETGPLRVRMALHTGAAEARDSDYFGPPLNRTARLLAAGHGGQILLSLATQQLVYDHLPPEVTLRDLGEHQLKDLVHPEHIFQLTAPGLSADFPPLRSLASLHANLPLNAPTLIGREQEVTAASAMLHRPDVQLLTLTGPGGIGKTRLALQVGAELLDDFADGVFFVALQPISDPDLVISGIAQTLGVTDISSQPLTTRLQEALGDKQVLLILDNFEQVTAAAPLLAELLAACPRLKLLITSRAVLHLYGEHEFSVPPLELPDWQHLPPVERLHQYPAVQLFLDRAQAVKPDFTITEVNARAVVEICHRLDGLPLAIELAAARIKLLPPAALLGRLSSRLKLLTGGARNLPERHQTLRAAIDWSYQLLEPDEQRLFMRLGIFVGGCRLEAAEAVCGKLDVGDWSQAVGDEGAAVNLKPQALDALDVLEGLQSLLDKSLLRQEERSDGEPYFVMMETIHEYALEQLSMHGETEILQRQHATYYLALAKHAEPELTGAEQATWLERLEEEHDNFRAALGWTLEKGMTEIALRLATALWRFWFMHGHLREGRRWIETLLERSNGLPADMRAKALDGAGVLAINHGDYTRAKTFFKESLALWRELGDTRGIATSLGNLGRGLVEQGDYRPARAPLEEGLALFRELGDTRGVVGLINSLGLVALYEGDYTQAKTLYKESLALYREQGDKHGIAVLFGNLGLVALYEGDYVQAKALYETSLALYQQLGDKQGIAACLEDIAVGAGALGKAEGVARLLGVAEALRETIGVPLTPADLTHYTQRVAAARNLLGEDQFATAWAEGRMMPLEQAITYALDIIASAADAANNYAQTLRQQERTLRIEINEAQKNQQVTEITETDTFQQLREHARTIRRKH